jgi:hypothetical protein
MLCNHAAALVFFGIEWGVAQSVKVPGAFMSARFISPWIGPAMLALLGAVLLRGYATDWRRRIFFWAPFALVAAALVLGVRFHQP